MKLYSAWYCPFAQRVWMSLLYKQVKFEYTEIDPYQETPKWLELSKGTGQVPVLVLNKNNIIDSTLIMNQLDTLFPDTPPLFATQPEVIKNQKRWIEHINNNIVPYFYAYLKSTDNGEEKDKIENKLLSGITAFAEAIERDGPYFSGLTMNVVDLSFFPFAYRINILLEFYRNLSLPVSGECWDTYHKWYYEMLVRPEFKETSIDIPNYEKSLIEVYYPYSQGAEKIDVTVKLTV